MPGSGGRRRQAKLTNYHTKLEPQFPPTLAARVDEATGRSTFSVLPRGRGDNDRGDLLLIRGNEAILVDVSVTRPTATTAMRQHADINEQPGLAIADVEKLKHKHYDEKCKLHGWRFVPFVMETYGGMGAEAERLLLDMCEHAEEPLQFLAHARTLLSVTLQRGNAELAMAGARRRRIGQADFYWPSGGQHTEHDSEADGVHLPTDSQVAGRRRTARIQMEVDTGVVVGDTARPGQYLEHERDVHLRVTTGA